MPLNPSIIRWTDARCWIVGASTGIGAALAAALGAKGARVAVSARRAESLHAFAASMAPDRVGVLPLDVRDAAAFSLAATEIEHAWGGIDLVVFMAGAYQPVRAWDLRANDAREMVDINVTGVFNGLAAVMPQLLRQRSGTIALVSSVAGYRGLPKSLVYGATKAALINLAETLYLDLHDKGIGVCVVNPGFVRTPLTAANDFHMPALIEPEEAAREIIAGLERGRFEIHFPRRFTRWLKLLQLLPAGAYFRVVRRMVQA
jgi:NADP-dependent 3-hydroxy acid dehydrogenase YdfG